MNSDQGIDFERATEWALQCGPEQYAASDEDEENLARAYLAQRDLLKRASGLMLEAAKMLDRHNVYSEGAKEELRMKMFALLDEASFRESTKRRPCAAGRMKMKKLKLRTYQMWNVGLADEVGGSLSREFEVAAKTIDEAIAKAIQLGTQEDEATNKDSKNDPDFTPIKDLPVAISCKRGNKVSV